jgi:hypothetical protein
MALFIRQSFHGTLSDRLVDLTIGDLALQSMDHRAVSGFLQPIQQPPDLPLSYLQLQPRLPLCYQPFSRLLQHHQPVAFHLRHQ